MRAAEVAADDQKQKSPDDMGPGLGNPAHSPATNASNGGTATSTATDTPMDDTDEWT